MKGNLQNIRTRCDALLAEKIDNLAKNNEGDHSSSPLRAVLKVISELRERDDFRTIIKVKESLDLQEYQTENIRRDLSAYRNILRHQFDNDRRRQKVDLKTFLETTDGSRWKNPESMLLLLHGRNALSSSTEHSWLSPVAAELAETLMESDKSIAYEGCKKPSALELTLSYFIYQLLERKPALLRHASGFQEIMSQILIRENNEKRVGALCKALSRIINLHNGPVWIILNRPDLSMESSCAQYLSTMLALVKNATVELKIMVILRTEFWDVERSMKEIDIEGLDFGKFHRICMNQT